MEHVVGVVNGFVLTPFLCGSIRAYIIEETTIMKYELTDETQFVNFLELIWNKDQ